MKLDAIKNGFGKLRNLNLLLFIYICITVIITVQSLSLRPSIIDGHAYARYNNYLLFKQSFIHLVTHNDLYDVVTNRYRHADYQYWDYKYSPTFAVYMVFFAYLPTWLGLALWNLLNSLAVFFAVKMLPGLSDKYKSFILWFILIETMTAAQSTQSNALMAGLLLFAFIFLERRRVLVATLLIAASMYIKPFGALGFSLLLLYPDKVKSGLYSVFWTILLFALPLVFVSFGQLKFLYASWAKVLAYDHLTGYGLSVIGWLHTWFHVNVPKNLVVAAGAVIFLIPFIKYKLYETFYFRVLIVCSILIWVVIFNHKAESPTFIIAASGAALWYFSKPRKIGDLLLLFSVLLFTVLSPTEIFPRYVRQHFVNPYMLKAVPCIFVWFRIIHELITVKRPESVHSDPSSQPLPPSLLPN
jgi:hypothetical protein